MENEYNTLKELIVEGNKAIEKINHQMENCIFFIG